jgi:hypothetical protein
MVLTSAHPKPGRRDGCLARFRCRQLAKTFRDLQTVMNVITTDRLFL